MTSLLVDGDFYEVVIWVSEVQGANASNRSSPVHWTLLNINATSLQVCSDCRQWSLCDQTEVCRARSWTLGFGLKLLANLVEVQFLMPKAQGLSIPLEGDHLHAQHGRVEPDCVRHTFHG